MRLLSIVAVVLSIATAALAQVSQDRTKSTPIQTSLCELVRDPGPYDGKVVQLRARIWVWFETSQMVDESCGESPARIWLQFEESEDGHSRSQTPVVVRRDEAYLRMVRFLNAVPEPRQAKNCIDCRKYVVWATVTGRFDVIGTNDRPQWFITGAWKSRLVLQSVSDVKASPFKFQKSLVRLHRANGWDVPGLPAISEMKPAQTDHWSASGVQVAAEGFEIDDPQGRLTRELPNVSPDGESRFSFEMTRLAPRRVTRLSVEGKCYAYVVEVIEEYFDGKTGKGGYGQGYTLIFLDETGSGAFGTLIEFPPIFYFRKMPLPLWVTRQDDLPNRQKSSR